MFSLKSLLIFKIHDCLLFIYLDAWAPVPLNTRTRRNSTDVVLPTPATIVGKVYLLGFFLSVARLKLLKVHNA